MTAARAQKPRRPSKLLWTQEEQVRELARAGGLMLGRARAFIAPAVIRATGVHAARLRRVLKDLHRLKSVLTSIADGGA